MTFTYLPTTTDIGKIRLAIGDTTEASAIFTDEELQVFLTAEGSINLASAAALEAWASTYAANANAEKIGDYSYQQKIIDNMLKLAETLRTKESNIPAVTWAELDLPMTSERPTT